MVSAKKALLVSAAIILTPGLVSGQDIGCFIRGECFGGAPSGITSTATATECSSLCRDDANCNYFTFGPTEGVCVKFNDCPEISRKECPDCVSGDKNCFCGVSGNCIGSLVGLETNKEMDTCIEACKGAEVCNWWTFDPSDGFCTLFETCTDFDVTCTECISGGEYCPAGNPILVVADGHGLATTEGISLGNPNIQCPELPDFPGDASYPASFVYGDIPVLCGGVDYDPYCYQLVNDGQVWSWEVFTEMAEARDGPGFAQMGQDLFLAGGYNPATGYLSSSEILSPPSSSFVAGADLPLEFGYSCMAAINSTHAILSGGRNGNVDQNRVFIFNREEDSWLEITTMENEREYHSCGIIRPPGQSPKYVVAGGWDGSYLSSTEVLDLESMEWSQGQALPYPFQSANSVPFGDTFLVVGGLDDGGGYLNTIFEFDIFEMDWILRPEELQEARDSAFAVITSANYLGCS